MAIISNYKIKIVVFLFAVFIWFFVVTENDYEYVVDIPVTVRNLPTDKVILNDIPETAKVRVHGSGKALIALSLSHGMYVNLDVSDVSEKKTFILDPKKVNLSRASGGIRIVEVVSPDSIQVSLDDFLSRKLPVIPKIKVETASGHTVVGDVKIIPDSVIIEGPRTIVSNTEAVFTEPEAFDDLKFDLHATVALSPPPSSKVDLLTNKVDIYLDVQKLLERTVNEIPIQVRNVPDNLIVHVVPSTLSLVLEGGAELLSKITRDDIEVFIDYARVRTSLGNEYPAVIKPPQGVSYRNVNPRLFKIVRERRS